MNRIYHPSRSKAYVGILSVGLLLFTAQSGLCVEYICEDGSSPELVCPDGSTAELIPEEVAETKVEPLNMIVIVILITLSACFSGLTLGLLSLDPMGLQIIIDGGDAQEAAYARKIAPIRKKGNFLLCTLLLGNVAVNSLLSILMADLTSGFVGFALSSFLIVCFGEILPQAFCSRHPLKVGAKSVYLVYLFMGITFPLSFPISKVLDFVLGKELGTVYSKNELKKLVEMHGADQHGYLDQDEKAMLTGALDFGSKIVEQIMVPLEHVFMIDINRNLSFEFMQEILEKGHSRIPVYEHAKTNIIGFLYLSDLALLNPEDETPVRVILQFYGRPVQKVFNDTPLPELLKDFKKGKSHIKIVHRVNADGPGDPVYETVGIVTLEDIIEELIQDEIVDESDEYVDVVKKQSTHRGRFDYSRLSQLKKKPSQSELLSSEQKLAVFSYLRSNLAPFSSDKLSDGVLKKLVSHAHVVGLKGEAEEENAVQTKSIYEKGVPDQFFSLIIQGKIEVVSGNEGFVSQMGPFTYLGLPTLIQNNYIPDFTARPKIDSLLLRISRKQYQAALKATAVQTNPPTGRGAAISFSTADHDPLEDSFARRTQISNSTEPMLFSPLTDSSPPRRITPLARPPQLESSIDAEEDITDQKEEGHEMKKLKSRPKSPLLSPAEQGWSAKRK